mgnify:CR=1 FL=1
MSATDVLVFWAHGFHELLSEAAANRVVSHVQRGMGAVVLHSAHMCKPFRRLMGTSCTLKWREAEERERLWIVDPTHPVAKGLPEQIVIPHEEMYGEKFDIPTPDALIAIGWFQGGEVMRSVCAYQSDAAYGLTARYRGRKPVSCRTSRVRVFQHFVGLGFAPVIQTLV